MVENCAKWRQNGMKTGVFDVFMQFLTNSLLAYKSCGINILWLKIWMELNDFPNDLGKTSA